LAVSAEVRSKPAVFLDKDGTLLDDVPFNVDPDRITLAPGAAEGARLLTEAGYALVVVTNQSGVAHGAFPESALSRVEAHVRALVEAAGGRLLGFYYCPHDVSGSVAPFNRACGCRKPEPGLLHRAASELDLALDQAWLVGDILDDIEAGRRAGCRTILLDRGNETEWRFAPGRVPHRVASDLREAAEIILTDRAGWAAEPRCVLGAHVGGPSSVPDVRGNESRPARGNESRPARRNEPRRSCATESRRISRSRAADLGPRMLDPRGAPGPEPT
jgi:histidinol-phosphate phosphatase family protein